jgi:hypothetical protein
MKHRDRYISSTSYESDNLTDHFSTLRSSAAACFLLVPCTTGHFLKASLDESIVSGIPSSYLCFRQHFHRDMSIVRSFSQILPFPLSSLSHVQHLWHQSFSTTQTKQSAVSCSDALHTYPLLFQLKEVHMFFRCLCRSRIVCTLKLD